MCVRCKVHEVSMYTGRRRRDLSCQRSTSYLCAPVTGGETCRASGPRVIYVYRSPTARPVVPVTCKGSNVFQGHPSSLLFGTTG